MELKDDITLEILFDMFVHLKSIVFKLRENVKSHSDEIADLKKLAKKQVEYTGEILKCKPVNELKDICRTKKYIGFSKFKKDDLITFILNSGVESLEIENKVEKSSIKPKTSVSKNIKSLKNLNVISVRKKELQKRGYKDFKDWNQNPKHLYIGRNMSCYVPGTSKSKWANPFKSKKYGLERCLQMYEEHVLNSSLANDLYELKDFEEIGCWCAPKQCHGDVLKKLCSEL